MRSCIGLFRFGTTKIARLKEYKYPSWNPSEVKDNLIWIHGMFDSSKNFLHLAQYEELRKITNQTLLDCRNHGYSEHTETHTFPEMAYDLVEYIANRDMKDIYLVGHSMGGRIILGALRDHSAFLKDKIKGVVIADVLPSAYQMNDKGPIDQMYRYLEEMKQIQLIDRTYEEVEKEIKTKYNEAIAANLLSNIDVLQTGQLRWCVNIEACQNSFNQLMDFEVSNCLWEGPRKVIIGGKSKFTNLEKVAKTYPSVFTNFSMTKDVIQYDDAGHFVYLKDPQRFVTDISTFIKEVNDEHNSPRKQKQRFLDEALTFDI